MSSPTPIPNYRIRILTQIFRAIVLPPLFTYLLPLPQLWSCLLCVLSVPFFITVRTIWATHAQNLEARRLGARPVTRVKGRYPGNIDIMLFLARTVKEDYIYEFQRQMFEKYGELILNLRMLWDDQIITIDESHVKFILATRFEQFEKGYWVREKLENFLGNGIFNRDGDEWKAHRTLTRPFFARERISDFHTFEEYANETLAVLDRASAQSYPQSSTPKGAAGWETSATPVDAQDLYARFTLDSASTFLFGSCTDTLSVPLPMAGQAPMGPKGSRTEDDFGSFAVAFEETQTHIAKRFRYGNLVWPIMELLHDQTTKSTRVIRAWLDPMVCRAVAQKEVKFFVFAFWGDNPVLTRTFQERREKGYQSSSVEEATSLLDHLAESTDDTSLIRNELLNILLAARDTTACLLTFVTYIFALHPEIAARLRAEVLEHCGVDGIPSYEVMRGMKFMRAVLNETLRLFPPVPVNNRQSRGSVVLPPSKPAVLPHFPHASTSQGLYVPSGTSIMYSTLLIQRRKDLWGPDADNVDPDRWLDERVGHYTANPLIFAPFHAGPRICLGQNFAYNEASYFLIKLLQRYDGFALAHDAQPAESIPPAAWRTPYRKGRQTLEQAWPAGAFTLFAKGGLWVRFKRA